MMTNRQANELRSYQELGIGRAVTVESPERGGSRRPAETQRVFTLKAASIRSPSSEMRPANVQGGVSPEPPNLSLSVPQCPIRRGHPIGGAAERAAVDTVPARNRPRSGANRPVSGPKSVSRVSRFRRATLLEAGFLTDFEGVPPPPPAQPLRRPIGPMDPDTRRRQTKPNLGNLGSTGRNPAQPAPQTDELFADSNDAARPGAAAGLQGASESRGRGIDSTP